MVDKIIRSFGLFSFLIGALLIFISGTMTGNVVAGNVFPADFNYVGFILIVLGMMFMVFAQTEKK